MKGIPAASATPRPAEPETAAEPAPTVNLTGLLLAVLWLAFDALLAWIARSVIPPAVSWFRAHTSLKTQERTWQIVVRLVEAAEQTIVGPLRGPERLRWVLSSLSRLGIIVDQALVEAAVYEMHAQAAQTIAEAVKPPAPSAHSTDIPAALIDDGK